MIDRAAIVAHARASIARGSKSFALASRLFDPATRERAWMLYAWCRRADDLIDGQDHGHGMTRLDDQQERLALIRTLTEQALAGRDTGDPAFDALALVAAEVGIPSRYPRELIRGFEMDADGFMPHGEADLVRYCYHVAGVVGVMMALVMGVSRDDAPTLDRASDLGIAFQLANIARDLGEDDTAGRCYIPQEWLAELDIPPGELMRPAFRPRVAVIGNRLAALAARYEGSARVGAAALSYRSAWAVLAAAVIYGDIAREVAHRGATAWDRRVVTSRRRKLAAVSGAAAAAARRRAIAPVSRDGLWNRPA